MPSPALGAPGATPLRCDRRATKLSAEQAASRRRWGSRTVKLKAMWWPARPRCRSKTGGTWLSGVMGFLCRRYWRRRSTQTLLAQTLGADALAHDLLDELRITIAPVVVGSKPLVRENASTNVKLHRRNEPADGSRRPSLRTVGMKRSSCGGRNASEH